MNAIVLPYGSRPVRSEVVDGEPWFCLADVAEILEIKQPQHFLKSARCDKGGVRKTYTPSPSGPQEMVFINEGNLFTLIARSNKKEALDFQRWVNHELLPHLRKNGQLGTLPVVDDPVLAVLDMARKMREEQVETNNRISALEEKFDKLSRGRLEVSNIVETFPDPLTAFRQLTVREAIVDTVRALATHFRINQATIWILAYDKYCKQKRCNLVKLAAQKGLSKIAYIERHGDIDLLGAAVRDVAQRLMAS